ncbi:MAG: MFS transporter [Ktedonobacteraceae bacterium]|nr:MFS transporter [Ktedonobacteraceae bacterium]
MQISRADASKRWWMLVLLSLTLIVLTLNWFDIAAAFPQISQQFHLNISQLSNLIALFILGFAIFHIPAGALAYKIGVKNTLLLGLLVESLGAIACAFAPNYAVLALLRFVTGIGGSFLVGMTLSLITSWFRGKDLALAMGISGGACFTLGQAIGISGWVGVINGVGWQGAIIWVESLELSRFSCVSSSYTLPHMKHIDLSVAHFRGTLSAESLATRTSGLLA